MQLLLHPFPQPSSGWTGSSMMISSAAAGGGGVAISALIYKKTIAG